MTDDERRAAIFGDGSSDQSTTSAPTPPAPPDQTDDERRSAIFGSGSPAGGTWQPPSMVEPSDALEAFQAATLSGMGDVAGGIQRIFGHEPTLSTATQNKLTEQQKAGMAVHPWASGFGRMFGQTAATLPATLATAYAFPEVAGMSAIPLAVRGGYIGSLTGLENALLTSGQNPQEPLLPRAIHGAEIGAVTGGLGGYAEGYAGAGQTIPPNVQASGQRMQAAGADILPGNLPRTESPASTLGGPPTRAQAQQVNQGFGNIIGENTPDFTPGTLDSLLTKLGTDVGSAVKGGQIHADIPLTTTATAPNQTFSQRLAEIQADNPGIPMIKRIISGPQGILSKVDPATGEISGSDVGDILSHNSWLQRTARGTPDEASKAANQIEEAMQDAFRQSSSPGQAEAYRLAREKYKLGLAAQDATNPITGDLDSARLTGVMGKYYDDAKRLGAGSSLTDQGVQYARDAGQIFGGTQSAAPVAAHAPRWLAALGPVGAGAWELGSRYLPFALPSAIANPLVTAGAIAAPVAYRALLGALSHYPNTQAFANDLMRRGGQRAMPGIAGTAGSVGTSASQQPWF